MSDAVPLLGLTESWADASDDEVLSTTAEKNAGEGVAVMLKNVPSCYSGSMIVDALNAAGFSGKYSFVYLPFNFTRKVGNGYALVCPISIEDGLSIISAFEGFEWPLEHDAPCAASWSEPHQDLAELIERYRNSPVMHPSIPDEYKPMLFENGWRILFPAPTKTLKPPRIRHVKAPAEAEA